MAGLWTEIYRQHFERYFHKPFDVQVYHGPDNAALKIATHDWARQGFRVYASLGLADPLYRDEAETFGEVILFADVADKTVPQLFVNALFFILANEIPLDAPFAIGFGSMHRDFARRYDKTALYFSQPVEDDDTFNELEREEGTGCVRQAYFLTPDEDEFLETHGAAAFEAKFRSLFGVLSDEDRVDLMIDQSKREALDARLKELWQRANQALSLSRPSCV